MGEMKRILNKKFIFAIIAALFINLSVFVYIQLGGQSYTAFKNNVNQYNEVISKYDNMNLSDGLESIENDINNIEDKKEAALLFKTRIKVRDKLTYLVGFHNQVESIISQAEILKNRKLFSDPESFSYKNTIKTGEDYKRIENSEVELNNDRAVENFLEYKIGIYILLILMVMIIFQICSEKKAGLELLVYSTPGGRFHLALKRFVNISVILFVLELVIFVTTLATSVFLYGKGTFFSSIQCLEDYANTTFEFNQLQYILYYFLEIYLTLLALSMIIWLIYTIFEQNHIVTLFLTVFMGIEYVLYSKIDSHSVYFIFKRINIINLLNMNGVCRRYENILVFGRVESIQLVITVFYLIATLLILLLICMIYERRKPVRKKLFNKKITEKVEKIHQKIFIKSPIWLMEIHKLLFSIKGYLVIVFMFLIMVYCSYITCRTYDSFELEQVNEYNNNGGKNYKNIENKILEKYQQYEDALTAQMNAIKEYDAGNISFEDYYSIYSGYMYAMIQYNSYSVVKEKINYINTIKSQYDVNAWLVSDSEYNYMLGPHSYRRELMLLLVYSVGIFLFIVNFMTMEDANGMRALFCSSSKGLKSINKRKSVVCFACVLILDLVYIICQILWFDKMYGIYYLNAPLLSLSFIDAGTMFFARFLTIGKWIAMIFGIKVIVSLLITVITIILSIRWSKKKNTVGIPVMVTIILALVWIFIKSAWSFMYVSY